METTTAWHGIEYNNDCNHRPLMASPPSEWEPRPACAMQRPQAPPPMYPSAPPPYSRPQSSQYSDRRGLNTVRSDLDIRTVNTSRSDLDIRTNNTSRSDLDMRTNNTSRSDLDMRTVITPRSDLDMRTMNSRGDLDDSLQDLDEQDLMNLLPDVESSATTDTVHFSPDEEAAVFSDVMGGIRALDDYNNRTESNYDVTMTSHCGRTLNNVQLVDTRGDVPLAGQGAPLHGGMESESESEASSSGSEDSDTEIRAVTSSPGDVPVPGQSLIITVGGVQKIVPVKNALQAIPQSTKVLKQRRFSPKPVQPIAMRPAEGGVSHQVKPPRTSPRRRMKSRKIRDILQGMDKTDVKVLGPCSGPVLAQTMLPTASLSVVTAPKIGQQSIVQGMPQPSVQSIIQSQVVQRVQGQIPGVVQSTNQNGGQLNQSTNIIQQAMQHAQDLHNAESGAQVTPAPSDDGSSSTESSPRKTEPVHQNQLVTSLSTAVTLPSQTSPTSLSTMSQMTSQTVVTSSNSNSPTSVQTNCRQNQLEKSVQKLQIIDQTQNVHDGNGSSTLTTTQQNLSQNMQFLNQSLQNDPNGERKKQIIAMSSSSQINGQTVLTMNQNGQIIQQIIPQNILTSNNLQTLQNLNAQSMQTIQGLQNMQNVSSLSGLQNVQGLQSLQGLQNLHGLQNMSNLRNLHGVQNIQTLQSLQNIQGLQQAVHFPQTIQTVQGLQQINARGLHHGGLQTENITLANGNVISVLKSGNTTTQFLSNMGGMNNMAANVCVMADGSLRAITGPVCQNVLGGGLIGQTLVQSPPKILGTGVMRAGQTGSTMRPIYTGSQGNQPILLPQGQALPASFILPQQIQSLNSPLNVMTAQANMVTSPTLKVMTSPQTFIAPQEMTSPQQSPQKIVTSLMSPPKPQRLISPKSAKSPQKRSPKTPKSTPKTSPNQSPKPDGVKTPPSPKPVSPSTSVSGRKFSFNERMAALNSPSVTSSHPRGGTVVTQEGGVVTKTLPVVTRHDGSVVAEALPQGARIAAKVAVACADLVEPGSHYSDHTIDPITYLDDYTTLKKSDLMTSQASDVTVCSVTSSTMAPCTERLVSTKSSSVVVASADSLTSQTPERMTSQPHSPPSTQISSTSSPRSMTSYTNPSPKVTSSHIPHSPDSPDMTSSLSSPEPEVSSTRGEWPEADSVTEPRSPTSDPAPVHSNNPEPEPATTNPESQPLEPSQLHNKPSTTDSPGELPTQASTSTNTRAPPSGRFILPPHLITTEPISDDDDAVSMNDGHSVFSEMSETSQTDSTVSRDSLETGSRSHKSPVLSLAVVLEDLGGTTGFNNKRGRRPKNRGPNKIDRRRKAYRSKSVSKITADPADQISSDLVTSQVRDVTSDVKMTSLRTLRRTSRSRSKGDEELPVEPQVCDVTPINGSENETETDVSNCQSGTHRSNPRARNEHARFHSVIVEKSRDQVWQSIQVTTVEKPSKQVSSKNNPEINLGDVKSDTNLTVTEPKREVRGRGRPRKQQKNKKPGSQNLEEKNDEIRPRENCQTAETDSDVTPVVEQQSGVTSLTSDHLPTVNVINDQTGSVSRDVITDQSRSVSRDVINDQTRTVSHDVINDQSRSVSHDVIESGTTESLDVVESGIGTTLVVKKKKKSRVHVMMRTGKRRRRKKPVDDRSDTTSNASLQIDVKRTELQVREKPTSSGTLADLIREIGKPRTSKKPSATVVGELLGKPSNSKKHSADLVGETGKPSTSKKPTATVVGELGKPSTSKKPSVDLVGETGKPSTSKIPTANVVGESGKPVSARHAPRQPSKLSKRSGEKVTELKKRCKTNPSDDVQTSGRILSTNTSSMTSLPGMSGPAFTAARGQDIRSLMFGGKVRDSTETPSRDLALSGSFGPRPIRASLDATRVTLPPPIMKPKREDKTKLKVKKFRSKHKNVVDPVFLVDLDELTETIEKMLIGPLATIPDDVIPSVFYCDAKPRRRKDDVIQRRERRKLRAELQMSDDDVTSGSESLEFPTEKKKKKVDKSTKAKKCVETSQSNNPERLVKRLPLKKRHKLFTESLHQEPQISTSIQNNPPKTKVKNRKRGQTLKVTDLTKNSSNDEGRNQGVHKSRRNVGRPRKFSPYITMDDIRKRRASRKSAHHTNSPRQECRQEGEESEGSNTDDRGGGGSSPQSHPQHPHRKLTRRGGDSSDEDGGREERRVVDYSGDSAPHEDAETSSNTTPEKPCAEPPGGEDNMADNMADISDVTPVLETSVIVEIDYTDMLNEVKSEMKLSGRRSKKSSFSSDHDVRSDRRNKPGDTTDDAAVTVHCEDHQTGELSSGDMDDIQGCLKCKHLQSQHELLGKGHRKRKIRSPSPFIVAKKARKSPGKVKTKLDPDDGESPVKKRKKMNKESRDTYESSISHEGSKMSRVKSEMDEELDPKCGKSSPFREYHPLPNLARSKNKLSLDSSLERPKARRNLTTGRKKRYQKAGLFSDVYKDSSDGKTVTDDTPEGVSTDDVSATERLFPLLPPPVHVGEYLRMKHEEFTLPYDIWLQYQQNSLHRASALPAPRYKKLRNNVHYDVKPTAVEDLHVCSCRLPTEMGQLACGEDCLNRLIYTECTLNTCPCWEQCTNKRIQRHEWAPGLKLFKTLNRGYGVRSTKYIHTGEFICEYLGEVVSVHEFKRRMSEDYCEERNHYCLNLDSGTVIDGYKMGSICRFVNHSCEPNCEMQKWNVNGIYRMVLFALRDILPREELVYDYNFQNYNLDSQQSCKCMSSLCRGIIGGKSQRRNSSCGSETKLNTSKNKRKKAKRKIKQLKTFGTPSRGSRGVTSMRTPSWREISFIQKHGVLLVRNLEKVRRSQVVETVEETPADRSISRKDVFMSQLLALTTCRSVKTRRLTIAEGEDLTRTAELARILQEIYNKMANYKDTDGCLLSTPLMSLPSRRRLPDYYKIITRPICLSAIEEKIQTGQYDSPETFHDDVMLLFSNVTLYCGVESELGEYVRTLSKIYQDATDDQNGLLQVYSREAPHDMDSAPTTAGPHDTESAPSTTAPHDMESAPSSAVPHDMDSAPHALDSPPSELSHQTEPDTVTTSSQVAPSGDQNSPANQPARLVVAPPGGECEDADSGYLIAGCDPREEDMIRCICGVYKDEGLMVQCDRCFMWQHVDCMLVAGDEISYMCEICQPRYVDKEVRLHRDLSKSIKRTLATTKPLLPAPSIGESENETTLVQASARTGLVGGSDQSEAMETGPVSGSDASSRKLDGVAISDQSLPDPSQGVAIKEQSVPDAGSASTSTSDDPKNADITVQSETEDASQSETTAESVSQSTTASADVSQSGATTIAASQSPLPNQSQPSSTASRASESQSSEIEADQSESLAQSTPQSLSQSASLAQSTPQSPNQSASLAQSTPVSPNQSVSLAQSPSQSASQAQSPSQSEVDYMTLMTSNNQIVRLHDTVYITRNEADDDRPVRVPFTRTTRFNPEHYDILRVERLYKQSGERYVMGHLYLRPHETFHEPTRKFFHNELFRVPVYEIMNLDAVAGRCFVMDLPTYCKGRHVDCLNERDVYICELRVDKSARMFNKVGKSKYPYNTRPYCFRLFSQRLQPKRTYTPHEVPESYKRRTGHDDTASIADSEMSMDIIKPRKKRQSDSSDDEPLVKYKAEKRKQKSERLNKLLLTFVEKSAEDDRLDVTYLLERTKRARKKPSRLELD